MIWICIGIVGWSNLTLAGATDAPNAYRMCFDARRCLLSEVPVFYAGQGSKNCDKTAQQQEGMDRPLTFRALAGDLEEREMLTRIGEGILKLLEFVGSLIVALMEGDTE